MSFRLLPIALVAVTIGCVPMGQFPQDDGRDPRGPSVRQLADRAPRYRSDGTMVPPSVPDDSLRTAPDERARNDPNQNARKERIRAAFDIASIAIALFRMPSMGNFVVALPELP